MEKQQFMSRRLLFKKGLLRLWQLKIAYEVLTITEYEAMHVQNE